MILFISVLFIISSGLYFLLWKCKQKVRILWSLGFFVASCAILITMLIIGGDKPTEGSVPYFPVIQKRYRYLIPNNYEGWLFVIYDVPEAHSLRIEDGFKVVKFLPSGISKTSDSVITGKLVDEYYYYDGDTLKQVPAEHIGGGLTVQKNIAGETIFYFCFWVGSSEKFEQENRDGPPVPMGL